MTAVAGMAGIGMSAGSPDVAMAQSSGPHINAIDDRPAARLRRARDMETAAPSATQGLAPTLQPQTPQLQMPVAAARPKGAPEMVVIPPGTFMMGSPLHQRKRDRNEGPQVSITIDRPFEIGRYEVTFDEWNKCVKGGGCRRYRPDDNGWGRGKRPVTNISYNDAQSYIEWLNKKTGLTYRLPSEAEWEYVARAGQPLPFSTPTGRGISALEANFNGKFPYGPGTIEGEYKRQTVPVGSYPANSFGVHDIHGNVYEFVSDCYVAGHAGHPGDGSPRRDGNCDARIIRGGSWVTHGYQMRAAKRLRYTMDHRYDDFGFRLARTID
ncbi:formylglycine-generating enzyme family protein [uncultured Algimonas sp.]|uniref:formylglycine-generating enzyme family protein n=1 Tax=uncultured Algimonas sp. TaxID=1547920 RepID=UPI002609F3F7|nr:formylglycine-generating enzyme family protein [uncultured Algimonas sp.]